MFVDSGSDLETVTDNVAAETADTIDITVNAVEEEAAEETTVPAAPVLPEDDDYVALEGSEYNFSYATIEDADSGIITYWLKAGTDGFGRAMNKVYRRQAARFNVPGYRRGKAPMGLALRYYGEQVLYSDILDEMLFPAAGEVVQMPGRRLLAEPALDILEIGGDKGLTLICRVMYLPQAELGEYRNVAAVRPEHKVTDEEVDIRIEATRKQNARMVPVEDRPAESGDIVTIDYAGRLADFDGDDPQDAYFEGGTAENFDLTLGSNSFIPGFEDKIIGHEAGSEFEIELSFPEDYHAEELKGKPVVFEISLKSIKVEELPELDDDYASDISEFDSFAAYRADLTEKMQKEADERNDHLFQHNVMHAIIDNAQVNLPEAVVSARIEGEKQHVERQYAQYGITFEQFLSFSGKTEEDWRHEMAHSVEHSLSEQIVVEAIVAAEQPEVTAEALEAYVNEHAAEMGATPERLLTMYEESRETDWKRDPWRLNNFYDMLNAQIKNKMVMDEIYAAAVAMPETEDVVVGD